MRIPVLTGFSFGLTSGVITTLGLMIGLNSGTHSKIAVAGGILTIAIADAFSDAFGIHISQESQNKYSQRSIRDSTVSAFLSKFVFALTFLVPVIFLRLSTAIVIGIVWGFSILFLFSFIMAKQKKENPWRVGFEHLATGVLVVVITHFVGKWVQEVFN